MITNIMSIYPTGIEYRFVASETAMTTAALSAKTED